ncbi:MAG: hypothetical protein A4E63_01989 [Syntrophorhabdus sp. PtaU1.Bin050]|nr:MAG: hypothetical protein A4E63_01989 [Syntrophorhabdus sp. PtaU1.Bin050]
MTGNAEEKVRTIMKITGKIVRGVEESKDFLSIPWVDQQLSEKLHFNAYKGTLNIMVDDPEVQRNLKRQGKDRLVHETEGFCDALVFRGSLNNTFACGVILPLVPVYDECLLEIVAPVHLKKTLGLNDGDIVTLELYL